MGEAANNSTVLLGVLLAAMGHESHGLSKVYFVGIGHRGSDYFRTSIGQEWQLQRTEGDLSRLSGMGIKE